VKRGELRRQLRRRAKELRAQLSDARRQVRDRVAGLEVVQRERRRRRLKQAAGLAIVIALLLLIRCDCGRVSPEVAAEVAPVVDAGVQPRPTVATASKALEARVERQPRAAFTTQAQEASSWLDEFRLQVAARSPRLARCFSGAEHPGALRWSVALNPSSGAVSDHQLDLVGPDPDLQTKQRECLERALSSPPYALAGASEDALARRVSLVIEF